MYEYLLGKVVRREEGECVIDVDGLGFLLKITPYSSIAVGDEKAKLYIRSILQADGEQAFYGFEDPRERDIFDALRGIKGIGPRTSLRILSRVKWDELCELIQTESADILSTRSGLGKKTVSRIMLELKPHLQNVTLDERKGINQKVWIETRQVLEKLGYSTSEIERTMRNILEKEQISYTDTETFVKKALMVMGEKD